MRLRQVRAAIDDAIVGILIALLELRIRSPKVLRTQIRRWSINQLERQHPLRESLPVISHST
jgi:hypothetical protein